MRRLILPLVALASFTANAQFSVRPQLGLEALRTKIQLNDLSAFSPSGTQLAPRIGLRMAYKLKTGHGAFVGVTTGSPAPDFKFTNPQTAQTSFTTSANAMPLRLEGGYQYTTKAIRLSKPSLKQNSSASSSFSSYAKSGGHACGGHFRCAMRCSSNTCSKSLYSKVAQDKGLYMRIQPSVGLAFASPQKGIETNTKNSVTTYQYNTGWNTALITGTTFEFGSRKQTKFSVSVNYLKSLGNNSEVVYAGSAKDLPTTFKSATSGFNVAVGIPFNFAKKKVVAPPPPPIYYRSAYHHCGQYRT
jgi:hypothetical protein